MTDYQRNRIEVYNRKIEDIQMQRGFFKRNFVKVILFGLGFCFLGPFYSGFDGILGNRHTIIQEAGSYWKTVIMCAAVFYGFCIIGHLLFGIQDKYRIQEYRKLIKEMSN